MRNWLDSLGWDKPPAPEMPEDVTRRTSQKYRDALERLTGEKTVIGIVDGIDLRLGNDEGGGKVLEEFGVPYEAKAMSAHRTPHAVAEWATGAEKNGKKAIIAGRWRRGAPCQA